MMNKIKSIIALSIIVFIPFGLMLWIRNHQSTGFATLELITYPLLFGGLSIAVLVLIKKYFLSEKLKDFNSGAGKWTTDIAWGLILTSIFFNIFHMITRFVLISYVLQSFFKDCRSIRMNLRLTVLLIFLLASSGYSLAQDTNAEKDSLYIQRVEDQAEPDKVLHAEPLYIDLIRDLGARKGEKEWNIGLGLTDKLEFDSYETLIEYEWAPIDRLGLEIELPFTFYSPINGTANDSIPSNQLNSLQIAAQWSFFVSEPMAVSMALGYLNEFELSDFSNFGKPLIKGNVYNPFLVIAKRWGNNFHTLLYTGPVMEHIFSTGEFETAYDINTSIHYMISGTQNFIGVEINKTIDEGDFDMTLRPQMRLGIADDLMIGIVTGIPLSKENERLSAFLRLIWEPEHITK